MSRYVMIPWFDELAELSWCDLPPGSSVHVRGQGKEPNQYFVNDYTNRTMMVVERPSFPQEIVAAAEAVREDVDKAFMLHDALLERGWDGMAKAAELSPEIEVLDNGGTFKRTYLGKLQAVLTVILGELPYQTAPPKHWNARCMTLPLEK